MEQPKRVMAQTYTYDKPHAYHASTPKPSEPAKEQPKQLLRNQQEPPTRIFSQVLLKYMIIALLRIFLFVLIKIVECELCHADTFST